MRGRIYFIPWHPSLPIHNIQFTVLRLELESSSILIELMAPFVSVYVWYYAYEEWRMNWMVDDIRGDSREYRLMSS